MIRFSQQIPIYFLSSAQLADLLGNETRKDLWFESSDSLHLKEYLDKNPLLDCSKSC